jgi:hypothetical protein
MKRKLILLTIFLALTFNSFANSIDIFDSYQIRNKKLDNFQEAEQYILEGKKKYEEGELEAAKEQFIRALKEATNPDWYYILGDILYDLREYDLSTTSYEIAGDLKYERRDLAYYNAACSSSLSGNQYSALVNLQYALTYGYDYWEHMNNDSDLDFIRDSNEFDLLIKRYHIPERLNIDTTDFPSEYFLDNTFFRTDLDGDDVDELILYCLLDGINDPLGTYYFSLYKKNRNEWVFVNRTIPNLRSNPGGTRTFQKVLSSLDSKKFKKPFIQINLDGELGNELIIPSSGMTYYSSKILDYQKDELVEVFEIEGLEIILNISDEYQIVGHQVTDGAYFDGTSEEYSVYILSNGKISQIEMNLEVREYLGKIKYTKYYDEPSIMNLSSLFWFLFNHNKESLSIGWIEKHIEILESIEYQESFYEVMSNEIKE